MNKALKIIAISSLLLISACSSNPSASRSNNTVGGAVVGGLWGAGAGAVVGNQLAPQRVGEGAAVGLGLGMISGAMQGAGFDAAENRIDDQEEELDELSVKNKANSLMIANIQDRLDNESHPNVESLVYQVFFESDATNLKFGAVKNLEHVADQMISSSRLEKVLVEGHSDETGSKDYNEKLALARANSVAAYLMGRGLSKDQLEISSKGAEQPVASNRTNEGRQLNRRVDVSLMTN